MSLKADEFIWNKQGFLVTVCAGTFFQEKKKKFFNVYNQRISYLRYFLYVLSTICDFWLLTKY